MLCTHHMRSNHRDEMLGKILRWKEASKGCSPLGQNEWKAFLRQTWDSNKWLMNDTFTNSCTLSLASSLISCTLSLTSSLIILACSELAVITQWVSHVRWMCLFCLVQSHIEKWPCQSAVIDKTELGSFSHHWMGSVQSEAKLMICQRRMQHVRRGMWL